MSFKPVRTVAVIGAGISGLACAHALKKTGVSVVVVDMGSRGPGRRLLRPGTHAHVGIPTQLRTHDASGSFEAIAHGT